MRALTSCTRIDWDDWKRSRRMHPLITVKFLAHQMHRVGTLQSAVKSAFSFLEVEQAQVLASRARTDSEKVSDMITANIVVAIKEEPITLVKSMREFWRPRKKICLEFIPIDLNSNMTN
jgi:hypothetical protein